MLISARYRRCINTALATLFGALLCAIVSAQTIFEPAISVEGGRTSNVGITEGEEDDFLTYSLTLPVIRQTSQSELRFSLSAAARRYDEAEILDSENLDLSLSYLRQQSTKNRFEIEVKAERIEQREILPADLPSLTLRPLIEETRLAAGFRDDFRITERLTLGASASVQQGDFERLEGSGLPALELEDRDTASFEVELMRSSSSVLSIGPRYRHRRFNFETSPNTRTNGLGFALSRARPERSRIDLELGAYRVDGGPQDGEEGFEGSLTWSRLRGRNGFSLSVAQGLNAEDPFLGVTETQEALAGWTLSIGKMDAELGIGYGIQEPGRSDLPEDIETFIAGASIGVALSPLFSVLARASYAEDLSSIQAVTDFSEVFVGLSWFPLRNTRLGSLGSVRRDPTSTRIGRR